MPDTGQQEEPQALGTREGEPPRRAWLARWVKWHWLRVLIKAALCLVIVVVLAYVSITLYFGIRLKSTLHEMPSVCRRL